MMLQRKLPDVEQLNEKGSCWSCVKLDLDCDASLPRCHTCASSGLPCPGYSARLRWPWSESVRNASDKTRHNSQPSDSLIRIIEAPRIQPGASVSSRPSSPTPRLSVQHSLSPFGLQPLENDLLQHYIRQYITTFISPSDTRQQGHNLSLGHVANITLAVDYSSNGYRWLVPMAIEEPALLSVMFAVAASHRSKWRGTEDTESKRYLRQALLSLQKAMKDPAIAKRESTLGTMLCLLSFEVFNGSPKWKSHFVAIAGWIKSRRNSSDINPFLKNWISMIDTQSAMNDGQVRISEIEGWLRIPEDQRNDAAVAIDPLFGCSVQLPNLMLDAARLYHLSHSAEAANIEVQSEIRRRADILQAKVRHTARPIHSEPKLAVSCDRTLTIYAPMNELGQPDYALRIIATAEIFRHALHVYISRIVTGPSCPPDHTAQASIDAAFDLLPFVPDAIGPGSNLGWALVVIGSETDAPELREYIRCRWRALKLLELNNTESGERVVESVWQRRDAADPAHRWRDNWHWQDVMKTCGGEQILL